MIRIQEIANIVEATILNPALNLSRGVEHAFSSDLMSDVLTQDYEQTILITGLSNLQAIRTAEMSDISQIIIARGKEVSKEMIELASESDIVLMSCDYSLFKISGMLYEAGVKPVF